MIPDIRYLAGRHRRMLVIVLLILVILGIADVAARVLHGSEIFDAQISKSFNEQNTAIAVESSLVAVPVNVTDAHGNFVPGLTRSDFRVYENNQSRDISVFEQEDTPVAVGLLVDHSGSMATKLREVATAISGFAEASNPEDEMFVVDFADGVNLGTPGGKAFTNSSEEIQKDILAVSAQGQTALYDAVVTGLDHLQLAHRMRHALLIVSDGGDNISRRKFPQILESARASEVVIYSIGLVDKNGEEENPGILQELSRDTGGIAFFPHSDAEIKEATTHIAQDLREQYLLGFVPETAAEEYPYRKIKVKIMTDHRVTLRVRTRPGYSLAGTKSLKK